MPKIKVLRPLFDNEAHISTKLPSKFHPSWSQPETLFLWQTINKYLVLETDGWKQLNSANSDGFSLKLERDYFQSTA